MIRGFDISENNASGETGLVPEEIFDEAVKAGCRFVYVRSSWGNGHEDSCFKDSVDKAHARGLLAECAPDGDAAAFAQVAEVFASETKRPSA